MYKVEHIDAGGLFSASHTDEGLVCRYVSFLTFVSKTHADFAHLFSSTGPGIVYIQNAETLSAWIADRVSDTN